MSINWHLFLAQGAGPVIADPLKGVSDSFRLSPQMMIFIGVIIVLTLTLFFWAFFIRKRQVADPRMRPLDEGVVLDSSSGHRKGAREGRGRHGRRRHRRRHHSDLEKLPTLKETGGLPPIRPDDQLPRV